MAIDQVVEVLRIRGAVDLFRESAADFGLIAITNRFFEQLAKRFFDEQLTEYVENLATERC